ncbi:hypothetical protein CERSUDRAFT_112780 [Gelatoporia subvermispora B]|uniref:Cytochrome c oxidase assembly protein n=1 Tax=Ceriporiopsis subvermispora (strain B) TaxID=914234 RepID=M2R3I5_CERS8|nr:hypothetical protein CERSUDRAFT_112780 [Gelatoporia subvermispora B]
MSRVAKITFASSIILSAGIVWGVHYMQQQERETMYQGVLRDDERRREKMRQREEDLRESQRKRALYERFQPVSGSVPPQQVTDSETEG